MKRIFLIAFTLLLTYSLYAKSISLEWLEDKTIYIGEDSVALPYFVDAAYIDGSMLPYFTYSIPLSTYDAENFEYNVTITSTQSSMANYELDSDRIASDYKLMSQVTCSRGEYALDIYLMPFKANNATYTRLESFDLNIHKKAIFKLKSATSWFANNSVLAQGQWAKIGVKETGIYKLTYKQIKRMGLNPEKVSFFTSQAGQLSFMIQDYIDDLKEIPVYDAGDYYLFFASSQDVWDYDAKNQRFIHKQHPFWNENYFFLSDDVGQQKRINTAIAIEGEATKTYTSYIDYDVIEPQVTNIDNSGDDWYSEAVKNGNTFSKTFTFKNLLLEPADMVMRMAAQSFSSSHTMTTYIDGKQLSRISLPTTSNSHTAQAAFGITKTYNFMPQANSITASMNFSSADVFGKGFVDFFSVNVTCDLDLYKDFLCFRNYPRTDSIVRYELKNSNEATQIWDVSNPFDVERINGNLESNILSFKTINSQYKEYVAIDMAGDFLVPNIYDKVENQNLHGLEVPDMVILTVSEFTEEAEKLANIHREEGLDVTIIDPKKIYNEYSGGKADITAIRWFIKSLYEKDSEKLKYFLFLGDADVNNRMYEGDPLRLMCYQSDESFNRTEYYVSDDYFGFLDDNEGASLESLDKVDIGIGRIPVNSKEDIQAVVEKIDNYLHHSKPTDWTNRICIVADDQDDNTHVDDADKLAEKLRTENPGMAIKKVYIDAFNQVKEASGDSYPDAKSLIDQYIEDGVLIWGYSGHGSSNALASEGVMHINDVNSYKNRDNLPLWVTATCDFCPYDHNENISAGERVLLNPMGGGIALFTTTRLVYSSSNYLITDKFYSYILDFDSQGEKLRLGDVVRLTKKSIATGANKRKFCLIGDPALQLLQADANWEVKTDSINGIQVELFSDTLQALSLMKVSGYIAKADGTIDDNFNGVLYPTVYDKISEMKTLGNDSDSQSMDFLMWNSILFRGKTDVTNGCFTFDFLLPKDLNYIPGNARIEYFVVGEQADVNGYFEDFYIGGFNENFVLDTEGPEVNAYINSDAFSDGDIVNSNPVLLADIYDDSGINTSGSSIGHDITIKLNNDASTIVVINNSYVSNIGDYKEGKLSYTLKDLEEGEYTLTLKLWDMQNNSTTKKIAFEVRDDTKPDISAVYCYPNPVSLSSGKMVRFVAVHDRPENMLEVKLNIYDSQAKLIYQDSNNSSTLNNDIYFDWTPNHSFQPGLYFYRIVINDGNKSSAGQSQKLLIID